MKPPPSDALQNLLGRHWHHLPASEVGRLLETNLEAGLDLFEVKHRRERFGPNQLTPKPGQRPWMRFLLQFRNPLIYIMLADRAAEMFRVHAHGAGKVTAVVGVHETHPRQGVPGLGRMRHAIRVENNRPLVLMGREEVRQVRGSEVHRPAEVKGGKLGRRATPTRNP